MVAEWATEEDGVPDSTHRAESMVGVSSEARRGGLRNHRLVEIRRTSVSKGLVSRAREQYPRPASRSEGTLPAGLHGRADSVGKGRLELCDSHHQHLYEGAFPT
jgi:hypothetical protein